MKLHKNTYSDDVYVKGVYKHDPAMERALYMYCKAYFDKNYKSVFFADDNCKTDIFQESFIKLWENIEQRRIYAEDGVLKGKDGHPFTSNLTTYFMGIAKMKYLEWVRKQQSFICLDKEIFELLFDRDDEREVKLAMIDECVSHMSPRCNQIITMFYGEMKSLDDIMTELPSFGSKDALKTLKYKCMENLRDSVKMMYNRHLNA